VQNSESTPRENTAHCLGTELQHKYTSECSTTTQKLRITTTLGANLKKKKTPAKQRIINAKINQLNIIPGLFWLRKKTDLRFLGVGGGGDRSSFRHGEQQDSLLYLVHTIISNEMKSSRAS
jgi:hypothetical protein